MSEFAEQYDPAPAAEEVVPWVSINEIATALAKAQGAFKTPKLDCKADIKGREGKQGYEYKYASLHAIREAVTPALSENEIAVVQAPEHSDGRWLIRTRLVHSSGQFFECVWPMKFDGSRNQDAGSAMTYARRYSLTCITGIVASDDDDGNLADGNEVKGDLGSRGAPIEPGLIDDLNAGLIHKLLKASGSKEQDFCQWVGKDVLLVEQIPVGEVDRALKALRDKQERARVDATDVSGTST